MSTAHHVRLRRLVASPGSGPGSGPGPGPGSGPGPGPGPAARAVEHGEFLLDTFQVPGPVATVSVCVCVCVSLFIPFILFSFS